MTSPPKRPVVTPDGCGPVVSVRGEPVQGKAVPDTSEVLAWVDVKDDGDIALSGYDPVSYHAGADHGLTPCPHSHAIRCTLLTQCPHSHAILCTLLTEARALCVL